jgi:hypothetical protein
MRCKRCGADEGPLGCAGEASVLGRPLCWGGLSWAFPARRPLRGVLGVVPMRGPRARDEDGCVWNIFPPFGTRLIIGRPAACPRRPRARDEDGWTGSAPPTVTSPGLAGRTERTWTRIVPCPPSSIDGCCGGLELMRFGVITHE